MTTQPDLGSLEDRAYRRTYTDGIIDLFVGLSLLWIGAVWIWLPDYAGLAGVLPAIFVAPVLAWRKQVVEPRTGYVKWAAPRRQWERRNLIALVGVGVLLFLAGVGAFVAFNEAPTDTDVVTAVMPGLLAWLLALVTVGLGFLIQAWRMFAYAAVLAASGVVAALAEANPGWPLFIAGAVVATTGVVMLAVFLRSHPVAEVS